MRKTIDQRTSEAQQLSNTATNNIPNPANYNPLTVTDKVWGGNIAVRMHRGMPLPLRYEESRGVTLVSSEPMSLNAIANAVSAQTGIPVRLSALSLPAGGAASSSSSSDQEMPVSYEGPLSGLLDRLSAHFGVTWRFDGSAISILRYETRIFVVEALPGTQEINEGMKDDDSSSSGSGSSGSTTTSSATTNTLTQNSKTSMSIKYWDELSIALKAIIGGQGSVVISPSMGTITVTTTPDVMTTISDYIGKENKRLSRQIAISVQIYTVNLGKSEDFSATFTGFLKRIGNAAYTSAAVPGVINTDALGGLGNLNIAILNNPSGKAYAGSVFSALSTIGDTSQVAQFSMTTLNNRPVSRRVGTDRAFIQSVTETATTTITTQSTYTPVISTVHEGFSLQLTPRLLDDGRILLQYSLSLVGLQTLGTRDFNTGTSNVPLSLPVTDNRLFVQQSVLRSGQTLVIAGVDQETTQQNKQGVGSPENFLLGGGTSSDQARLMMFMALTPQVMDVSSDGERN
ncbi:MAG: secretin N-terminal domain-containing protein [Bdellovibrionales bacterium]